MEVRALVSVALLARAQRAEVLRRFRHNVGAQREFYPSDVLQPDDDVEVHDRIVLELLLLERALR